MINEDKIREACASDKEHGFKLLMENFQQPIYWHIRRLVVSHEDAEDILQEVFIRVFRHLDRFREESSLGTWMYRIATNECLRFLNSRKEQAVSAEEVQEELMNKLMASDYVDYDNAMAVKFQQAILSLPEKQRIVFNLRYYDELDYEEISRITDTRAETLKVNYHYAKEVNGVKVVKAVIPMSADIVKDIAFRLKGEIPANLFVVIGSVDNNKPMLTVMISDDLVKAGQNAGKLVREAAKLIQGGGGGQPHFATAGGKNADGLNTAVDKVIELAAL